jgi:Rieske Fe-S protein
VVNWNNAENTWDCPCHGSRYDPFGNVLNGPAVEPLARRNLIEQQGEEEVAFGDDLGSSPA